MVTDKERDRWHSFAGKLEHVAHDFGFRSSRRLSKAQDAKKWWQQQTEADRRFVTRMVTIIEDFEAP